MASSVTTTAVTGLVDNSSNKSYGQILKSSAFIGGSSVINIFLGMIRAKAIAVLLGPGGMGLFGNYNAIADLARSVAGMGLGSSGVREIAQAAATGDHQRIARTAALVLRAAGFFAFIGAALVAALCVPIGWLAFGTFDHSWEIALLALAILFGSIGAAQMALIQGLRRIADLARASSFGALGGTIATIPIIYFLGERGVVVAIVTVALISLALTTYFSRRLRTAGVCLTWGELRSETRDLLKLGVVFMASGLMAQGVACLVRIIVTRGLGLDAAGFYQASWALGGLYIGMILQAMGADFLPRLSAVIQNHEEGNRLVNEQTEVSLLMAGPGVLATLTFAGPIIYLLNTSEFAPAVPLLRWICLGMFLRVVSWPMGFILIARGARKAFFWSEFAASALQLILVWIGMSWLGLQGTGVAFFAMYVVYSALVYAIVRPMTGFSWSSENRRIGLGFGLLIALVFTVSFVSSGLWYMAGGGILTVLSGLYSLRKICQLVPVDRLPAPVRRLAGLMRLLPPPKQR
jgi:PST family polysaccharide transporter